MYVCGGGGGRGAGFKYLRLNVNETVWKGITVSAKGEHLEIVALNWHDIQQYSVLSLFART